MTRPADTILEHYAQFDESTRLSGAFGEFEFARVRELVVRHLPPAPADIADVGGGPGAYAFWLASLGHRVHLIDIVPRHIKLAAVRQAEQGPTLASLAVGDARDLALPDASVDIVMLAGPLYHLTESADRLRVLHEARRILRATGLLLVVAINRYAGVIDGLTQGLVFDPEYIAMTVRELSSGVRTHPPSGMKTFRQAYFHLPTDLIAEVAAAGFEGGPCLGVIGPAWQVPDLDAAWADGDRRSVLMSLARQLERECILSPQLFCVPQKG